MVELGLRVGPCLVSCKMTLILIYFMIPCLPVHRSGTRLDVRGSREPGLAIPVSGFVFPAKFAPMSTLIAH
jgi:hypothetical protein